MAAGYLARDLRPDNDMPGGRHAQVMDFGIARAVNEAKGRGEVTAIGEAVAIQSAGGEPGAGGPRRT